MSTEELYPDLPYSTREALWLIDGGATPEDACRRVGIKVRTLEHTLLRAGISRADVMSAARHEDNQRKKAAA